MPGETMMTTTAGGTAATTTNGDFFRFGSFRISARAAKREKMKKLNNNQGALDRVVFAVRDDNGKQTC